jgi:hypothetical protein
MSAATQTRIAASTDDDGGGTMKGRAGIRGLLWLTWRQHRWPIAITAAATAVWTVWMLVTASKLATLAKGCGARGCHGSLDKAASYATYQMNTVVFIPALIALFWGVPLLAREYEQRTLPLAWSQDLTPLRWLWGKTAILGVLVAAMGAVLAGTAEHLAHNYHLYTGNSLFEGTAFQAGGWLPLTLMVAWLAVGIAAGAATRRTMPAIAVVAAAWVGRMVLMVRLRPSFMKPVEQLKPFAAMSTPNGKGSQLDLAHISTNDMMLGGNNVPFVDSHGGHHPASLVMNQWCSDDVLNGMQSSGKGSGTDPMLQCLQQHDIVGSLNRFQPASRMGTFHLIENCANLGLLAVSLLVAWWCVRRTRTTT